MQQMPQGHRPFQFDSHALHMVLTFLTFGSWAGIYWWRYHLARFRWQEATLLRIAEHVAERA